ncbi:FtsL-like putative cell division protein [Pedobacter sandarakinus]|uniref:FtsL-like putative cell division protein n=1 Tax=Pedobacter sandarakinus TaxID=353156 RepID=UPI00224507FA|nr:FtsL-like putative cell division protein [Pedobacter sandarakinus]MCX2575588.1 FtsL-like putative cell division protein [Pedobacter sandarakinus]
MNRFRPDIEEEEIGPEPELKATPKKPRTAEEKMDSNSFISKLFNDGLVSKEAATDALPFLCFLAFLGMVYIANSHFAVNNVRRIDKLNKEVKELRWEYKSLKADLMFKSKLTEVAKKVDTLGIKELIEPPKKIIVKSDEY